MSGRNNVSLVIIAVLVCYMECSAKVLKRLLYSTRDVQHVLPLPARCLSTNSQTKCQFKSPPARTLSTPRSSSSEASSVARPSSQLNRAETYHSLAPSTRCLTHRRLRSSLSPAPPSHPGRHHSSLSFPPSAFAVFLSSPITTLPSRPEPKEAQHLLLRPLA